MINQKQRQKYIFLNATKTQEEVSETAQKKCIFAGCKNFAQRCSIDFSNQLKERRLSYG
jgi:hypothetical protein